MTSQSPQNPWSATSQSPCRHPASRRNTAVPLRSHSAQLCSTIEASVSPLLSYERTRLPCPPPNQQPSTDNVPTTTTKKKKKPRRPAFSQAKGVVGPGFAQLKDKSMFEQFTGEKAISIVNEILQGAPEHTMYLQDIYARLKNMFPILTQTGNLDTSRWQNRIRGVLSTHHQFSTVPPPPEDKRGTAYWALVPGMQGVKKRKRSAATDTPQPAIAAPAPLGIWNSFVKSDAGPSTATSDTVGSTMGNAQLARGVSMPGVQSPATIISSTSSPIHEWHPPQGFIDLESPSARTATGPTRSTSIETLPRPSPFAMAFDRRLEVLPRVRGMDIDEWRPSRAMFVHAPSGDPDSVTPSGSSSFATPTSAFGRSSVVTIGGGMPFQGVPPPKTPNLYATPSTSYLKKHDCAGECGYHLGSAAADSKGKGKARAL